MFYEHLFLRIFFKENILWKNTNLWKWWVILFWETVFLGVFLKLILKSESNRCLFFPQECIPSFFAFSIEWIRISECILDTSFFGSILLEASLGDNQYEIGGYSFWYSCYYVARVLLCSGIQLVSWSTWSGIIGSISYHLTPPLNT